MDYNLGGLSQIPLGEGRNFVVDGTASTVFHTRKGVYASQAECPHRQGPLADGLIGGATVICPFHAWKFDLTTGEALMGQCGIQMYSVRLSESGELWLTYDGRPAVPGPVPAGEEIGVGQAEVGSAAGPALVA